MATSHKYACHAQHWTYGAELELIDWPRNASLLPGMAIDDGAWTNVNSNGVAADGPGKLYHLGGEVLTAPSDTPEGQVEQWEWIHDQWPEVGLNYRMGLNVHVRVPGLQDDLRMLKRLQAFVHHLMPQLLPIIDPIPVPSALLYQHPIALKGATKNYRTRKGDHHTLLPEWRLYLQMAARTPEEFFEAEAVHLPTGRVHWAVTLRACVNLRQLLQTDTVEFRHFPMPATGAELLNSVRWCKMFMEAALTPARISAKELLRRGYTGKAWPKFMPYDPWLDEGFHYTSRHFHKPIDVPGRIANWLNGAGRDSMFWEAHQLALKGN